MDFISLICEGRHSMDEKLVKKAIRGNFNAYSILVHSLKDEGYKIA